MGELHRKRMAQREREGKATEAQLNYLRRLCIEADGEVDEDWLQSLTKAQASAEIEQRVGVTRNGRQADGD